MPSSMSTLPGKEDEDEMFMNDPNDELGEGEKMSAATLFTTSIKAEGK